jgi:hypothetical protein
MHVGIDVHGVADLYPKLFESMSRNLMMNGHTVSIITGQEWDKVEPLVSKCRISYSHYFSIVDYHLAQGTKMSKDKKGTWWMEQDIWLRSKGLYMKRAKVDVHFDDSPEYALYIPSTTTFILVPKKNFTKVFSLYC